jgi:serine O-acetyltransferase
MQSFFQDLVTTNNKLNSLPSKRIIHHFIDDLISILFSNTSETVDSVARNLEQLKQEFNLLLQEFQLDTNQSTIQTRIFFESLPNLYHKTLQDAKVIYDNDPAAKSFEEVLYSYPGFYAIAVYRFSNQIWKQELYLLARTISEYAHTKTSIEIHPGAEIGNNFAIDHGTGIVIGETVVIGDNVQIYQGVTLGALSVKKDEAFLKRHPTIEDNVIIYANSTILGGKTIVGRDSIIGGNVWLTHSVPSNSVVYHKNEIKVKDNNPFPEPIFYSI